MAKLSVYQNKVLAKRLVLAASFLIGSLSLWYTNNLVQILTQRERQLIDLYAKALKALATSEDGGDQLFLFTDIVEVNTSIPVILTDENKQYISHRNFEIPEKLKGKKRDDHIARVIQEMAEVYPPVEINIEKYGIRQYIYYRDSEVIKLLRLYPYLMLGVIAIFGLVAYTIFSTSRRSEQNRVWVGLAKETAHQLGTPLSSLMAWVEILRYDERFAEDQTIVNELEKDVQRLEMITNRFSNIGSTPQMKEEDIIKTVNDTIDYLRWRISDKVKMNITVGREVPLPLNAVVNKPLLEWVIENICKNAVDAMNSSGEINLFITYLAEGRICIDINDNGKGISKKEVKKVFDAGFTTKRRGWGLGLTLAKRIIENYHKGKLFVLWSEVGKGTTFRIIIPQEV